MLVTRAGDGLAGEQPGAARQLKQFLDAYDGVETRRDSAR
jgi:hypothetical protein